VKGGGEKKGFGVKNVYVFGGKQKHSDTLKFAGSKKINGRQAAKFEETLKKDGSV